MDPDLIPKSAVGWGGWIVSAILAAFTVWVNFRKGRVDETANVLTAWQKMVERHEDELKRIADELRSERSDNTQLRARLRAAEDRITEQDGTIRELREQITGLQNQIIQNSKSTGSLIQLGDVASAAPTSAKRFATPPNGRRREDKS